MAVAIWRTRLGQSPGSDPAQLSGALCAPMVMLETCWWPSEAAAGGRHLRLARILFKMLRSSKAEISASCGKEENKFSTVSCRHHLQPLIPLGKLANFKHPFEFGSLEWKQVGSSPHLPFPGAPPVPRDQHTQLQGVPEARAAWGEGTAQPYALPKDRIQALQR